MLITCIAFLFSALKNYYAMIFTMYPALYLNCHFDIKFALVYIKEAPS